MILRRFMKHVTDQNWFAVGLDVIVVIVGIFLGLQVQAWYEDRADRQQEGYYIDRLHDEIVQAEQIASIYLPRTTTTQEALQHILSDFRTNGKFSEFTNLECNAITFSNIYSNFTPSLSTLDELESAGQSLIISNDNLRQLITAYKNRRGSADRISGQMFLNTVVMPEKYPEVIEVYTVDAGMDPITDTGNLCHLALIAENHGFRNDLVYNTRRFTTFNGTITRQFEALIELHRAVDEELGVTHTKNST